MDPLVNWIKIPARAAWPIVIVAAIVLWGPNWFNEGLGLDLFIAEYRVWLGVAFLFFLTTGLLPIIPWIVKHGRQHWEKTLVRRRQNELLSSLTDEEKALLQRFVNNCSKTQDLNIQDGVVGRLRQIGFLYLGFEVSYGGRRGSFTFPVNIADWLWDELRKNPDWIA